jgi:hypothetical protein
MGTDSFFALLCAGLIGTLLGLYLTFAGYRFFLVLLPVWGFFVGLFFGAHTMQSLFGMGFLATVTSWVVGFVVGAIFAVLSYLFYFFAVIMISGALGYAIGAGIMLAIFPEASFLTWVVGMIVAVALAFVSVYFNLQKYVVIIATSVLGAATVFGTFLFMFYPAAQLLKNPVQVALKGNPLLTILFLVLAVCGIVAQIRMNRSFEVTTYNRWEETAG